jgi:hypothetical protein
VVHRASCGARPADGRLRRESQRVARPCAATRSRGQGPGGCARRILTVRAGVAALPVPAAGPTGLIVRTGPARMTARADQPPVALPPGPAGRNQMAGRPALALLTLSSAYSRDSAHRMPLWGPNTRSWGGDLRLLVAAWNCQTTTEPGKAGLPPAGGTDTLRCLRWRTVPPGRRSWTACWSGRRSTPAKVMRSRRLAGGSPAATHGRGGSRSR